MGPGDKTCYTSSRIGLRAIVFEYFAAGIYICIPLQFPITVGLFSTPASRLWFSILLRFASRTNSVSQIPPSSP
jgi:hypothetical protein